MTSSPQVSRPRPISQHRALDDPELAERYRQVEINHQVAQLLDARALGVGTPDQAAALRRSAARRRELADRLMQQLVDLATRAERAEDEDGSRPAPRSGAAAARSPARRRSAR